MVGLSASMYVFPPLSSAVVIETFFLPYLVHRKLDILFAFPLCTLPCALAEVSSFALGIAWAKRSLLVSRGICYAIVAYKQRGSNTVGMPLSLLSSAALCRSNMPLAAS